MRVDSQFSTFKERRSEKMKDADFITNNKRVVEDFRANGGKGKNLSGLILVTIKGAKSGQPRIYPLMSVPDGENYIAVGSKGGSPKNPLWTNNLLAHPDVIVEVGDKKFTATARLLTGAEREQAFVKAVAVFPLYAEYQEKTTREIPVFLLER